jgi:hypothetical protein
MDFADMFARLETRGFTGHYMNQFGTLEDMLQARRYLMAEAARVGIA